MAKNDELSRLQRNARNKLYRLRKKGIVNAQIDGVTSPVKSWGAVEKMSAREKKDYANELREFTARTNRYKTEGQGGEYLLQPDSNIALPAQSVWRYRIAEAERNINRRAAAQSVEANAEVAYANMTAEQYENIKPFLVDLKEQNELTKYGEYRYASLQQLIRNVPFDSLKNLESATYRISSQTVQEREDRREEQYNNYRLSIVNRMSEEGYLSASLKDKLTKLTARQLDFLYYNTRFDEFASAFQYKVFYKKGRQGVSEEVKGEYSANIEQLIDSVPDL